MGELSRDFESFCLELEHLVARDDWPDPFTLHRVHQVMMRLAALSTDPLALHLDGETTLADITKLCAEPSNQALRFQILLEISGLRAYGLT